MSARTRRRAFRPAALAAAIGVGGLVGLTGFAGLVAFGDGPAAAQSAPTLNLVVDTPTDAVDAVPGDGICDDGTGHCTLRAALQETNRVAPVGTSTITLTTDVDLSIRPTGADGEDSGDLDVFGKVAIIGQKHRIHAHQIDRVIHQHIGKLNLSNVYIIGGVTPPDHPVGGGVWAEAFLNLNRTTLWANRAMGPGSAGGAIYGSPTSTITIKDSSIRSNVATDWLPQDSRGGGIASEGGLSITGSTISGNRVGYSLLGNGRGRGGGLALDGASSAVASTVIRANESTSVGGGVSSIGGSLALTDSTVSDNDTPLPFEASASGLDVRQGSALVERSTFSGNHGARTSMIQAAAASVTVRDSTILLGNGTTGSSTVSGDSIRIESSTIDTTFEAPSQGLPGPRLQGAITLTGSIVRARNGVACDQDMTSEGFNLVSDTSCGLSAATDREDVTVALGPLGGNGGPTATELLLSGSPGIDAIPVGTAGLCDGSAPTDQRGVTRPQGGSCDIGAVEGSSGGPPLVPLDLRVDSVGDEHDVAPGDGVCSTGTGACTLRAAVDEANAHPTADTVTVAAGLGTIALGVEDLVVSEALTLHGGGVTIDASATVTPIAFALYHISGVPLAIDHVSITGATGPAIFSLGGLRIDSSTFARNAKDVLHQSRTAVSVRGSTMSSPEDFSGVSTSFYGRAVDVDRSTFGGGLQVAGADPGRVTNSTITVGSVGPVNSEGVSAFYGQGLSLVLVDDTISVPVGCGCGGFALNLDAFNRFHDELGKVTISGTIAQGGCYLGEPDRRIVVSLGWNIGLRSCNADLQPGDQPDADPLLGPLADNGGPTPTLMPAADSPAVDAVPIGTPGLCDGTIATDQRGVMRPQGSACDIGAVER